MQFRVVLGFAFWLVLVLISGLSAQEAAPSDEGASPPAAQPGPQRVEFDHKFTEWKDMVAELGTLQARYYRASGQERAEIEKQWKVVIARGEALEPQLISAAEKAYAEAPNADKQLTDLLVDILLGDVLTREFAIQADNFERGLRIGSLLVENQCKDKRAYNAAGVAAFAMEDYERAEKYLKLARQKGAPFGGSGGTLDSLVLDFLNDPDRYKKALETEKKTRQAEAQADNLPRVLLKTSKGEIELELFENEAPNTVANFISLVKQGFYNGLTFHRVLPGFMAQGGCPRGDGTGGPGYNIPCECYQPNYRRHFRGSLSMAKGRQRDTGGSQFFLTFVPTSMLDGQHTVFGRVIRGLDVLHKIQRRDPEQPAQPPPDKILEAKVLRDRGHEYKPKKVGE